MKRLVALAACAALLGTGCLSTARFVEARPDGGIVAIPSNSNAWPAYHRDAATKLMADKCPNGYTIVMEKEVVVGQEVRTASSAESSTTVSAPKTEYQIEFRSVVQVPAGISPPPPLPATPPAPTTPPGLPPRPVPIG
ncbi:MAG: hypothetical protein ACRC33_09270 [Gemmataceae bacterium]